MHNVLDHFDFYAHTKFKNNIINDAWTIASWEGNVREKRDASEDYINI